MFKYEEELVGLMVKRWTRFNKSLIDLDEEILKTIGFSGTRKLSTQVKADLVEMAEVASDNIDL